MDVKRIRQVSGLTQKEFSDRYRIPLKTLQNWEADSSLPSARACPPYVIFLLEKAVKEDFPNTKTLMEADIDSRHLTAINHAKAKIQRSPLAKYVRDVLLYGSTARGQSKPSSDVDILLVLDERVKSNRRYNDWITYLKGNISSDDFRLPEADLHVVFGDNWQESNGAFFSNIKTEGFSIWN